MRPTHRALVLAFIAAGCDAPPPQPADAPSPAAPHSALHTPHSASVAGRVVWPGPAPQAGPIRGLSRRPDGSIGLLTRPPPNLPAVGPDGAVGGAVVYLRGIDPAAARTWDYPPVTVELHDERPIVRQGDAPPGDVGFVRRGAEVTIVSRQPIFHSLRARGAAFWTLTLPDPDRPRTRRLDRPGVVDLSSGVTYFWMHGYLWVCDHPYFTRTDPAGRWALAGVPPGEYDVVVWLPNWDLERRERDPETGGVARYVYRPPLEVTQRVVVRTGQAVTVEDTRFSP